VLFAVAVLFVTAALAAAVFALRCRPLASLAATGLIVEDGRSALPCRPLLLLDDLATKADALVADVDARPSDQPAYFALRLPTERAAQRAIDPLRGWRALEHKPSVFPFGANSYAPWARPSAADTAGMGDRYVLGGELEPCGTGPVTGFYRDGCCRTGPDDQGSHTICAVVTTRVPCAPAAHRRRPQHPRAPIPVPPGWCPATAGASPRRTGCGRTTMAPPRPWCWPQPMNGLYPTASAAQIQCGTRQS
jgi:Uncharacterized protein conserved in bacteria (DUF2237)